MKGKKQWKLAVILLFVAVCGAFYLRIQDFGGKVELLPESQYASEEKKETDPEAPVKENLPEEEAVELVIHVCGAVTREGVYRLPAGARIIDAVDAAGGFTKEAAQSYLNQADHLEDGIQIYIPSKKEVEEWEDRAGEEPPGSIGSIGGRQNPVNQEGADGKIDLNTAGKEELMNLPGIGEQKAEAILSYREAKGGFQQIEELMEIPGIKEGVFRKIEERVIVKSR